MRGEPMRELTPEALEAMQRYSWPGNVRELENALERAAILAKGDSIPLSALPERVVEPRADPLVSDAAQANPTLDTIERAYILWVLENEGGNKPRTAEVLGIDPSTLYRKLSRYGLPT
jgi:DNA-binding NtrC family response regulator